MIATSMKRREIAFALAVTLISLAPGVHAQSRVRGARTPHPQAVSAARLPVQTVLGWGAVAIGVGAGVASAFAWSETWRQHDASTSMREWISYNNRVNAPNDQGQRPLATSTVCDLARAGVSPRDDLAAVVEACDRNAGSRTVAWAFGATAVGLIAIGATVVALTPRSVTRPRAVFVPRFAPGLLGADLTITF